MAGDPTDDRKVFSPMSILVPTNDVPDRLPGIIEASRLERTQQIKACWLYHEILISVPRNILLALRAKHNHFRLLPLHEPIFICLSKLSETIRESQLHTQLHHFVTLVFDHRDQIWVIGRSRSKYLPQVFVCIVSGVSEGVVTSE